MSTNVVSFAWNRSIPGRERISAEHFRQFTQYVAGLQQQRRSIRRKPCFLDTHSGDLNGFFLVRGDSAKLEALLSSPDWVAHMTRAALHLKGSGHYPRRDGRAGHGADGTLDQDHAGVTAGAVAARFDPTCRARAPARGRRGPPRARRSPRVRSAIWCRQLVPSATISVSGAAARTAGSSDSSAIRIDTS